MMIPPNALIGHPDKFGTWFPGQWEAVQAIYDWFHNRDERFMGLSAPTGSGKSLLAMVTGVLSGTQMAVLTLTKGLQDQYTTDFGVVGLEDLRGQGNYRCLAPITNGNGWVSVEEGVCHEGVKCELREGGCTYYDQLYTCQTSDLITTNYAAWMALMNYGGEETRLDNVGLLVCDEGHGVFNAMENFLGFDLVDSKLALLSLTMPEGGEDWEWGKWVEWWRGVEYREGKTLREKRAVREFETWRGRVLKSSRDWAVEEVGNGMGYRFTPVWPSNYKWELFQDVPKVLLMSADLTRKHCYQLGIGEEELSWYDMASGFDPTLSPIYQIPTVRVRHKMSNEELEAWRGRIEQIVLGRMDRKGIVFTSSYNYARYVLGGGLNRMVNNEVLIGHTSQTTRDVVRGFKHSPPPRVLVSPAVGTGWDFPDDEARYGVVSKLPWPNTQSKVHKIRRAEDPEYEPHLIMGELVQQTGRLTRNNKDWAEVLIVDDQGMWFIPKWAHLAPDWWRKRLMGKRDVIPMPPGGERL